MQIAFHIGANCTDEDRLLKSLLRNADTLLKDGVAVPGPGRYRRLIRETIQGLDGAQPAPDTRDILIDAIVENDEIDRIILSNDNFICIPNRIFDGGVFYEQAGSKVRALHKLFPADDISLFLGIRNPATFLQDTFKRSKAASISEFLGLMRPSEIRWSDMIQRVRNAAPDTPLTVWCNEDTPLLWEQLIRAVSDVAPTTKVAGGLDMLAGIISRDGMTMLQKRLATETIETTTQKHEIIAEVWEQYALEERIEDEIDLPELDPALVQEMTDMYEADLARIAAVPGVQLLLPFS